MEKEKVDPSVCHEAPLILKSDGCVREKVFTQQEVPPKRGAAVQVKKNNAV